MRLFFLKKLFDRDYQQKWKGGLFQIRDSKMQKGKPIYTLSGCVGDHVKGTFYLEELQLVTISGETVYKVDKVMRSRTCRGQKEYLVQWLGLPSKYDSWVTSADLQDKVGGISSPLSSP